MATVLANPTGGRRMIRLSPSDVQSILAGYQGTFRGSSTPTMADIERWLASTPLYLPEDAV